MVAKYEILGFHCRTGKGSIPTATIRIQRPDGSVKDEAATDSVNGPVDATVNVINRTLLDLRVKLVDYKMDAVNPGSGSVGKVTVKIECEGAEYEVSVDGTDVLVASAEAIVRGVNQHVKHKDFEKSVMVHTV